MNAGPGKSSNSVEGSIRSDIETANVPARPVVQEFQARRVVAGRYEILSKLGKGGMGEVWHAYDLKLRLDVAMKSFRLDLKGGRDPVEALRDEVRTAREVISPNVYRIFDLVVEEDSERLRINFFSSIHSQPLILCSSLRRCYGPINFPPVTNLFVSIQNFWKLRAKKVL